MQGTMFWSKTALVHFFSFLYKVLYLKHVCLVTDVLLCFLPPCPVSLNLLLLSNSALLWSSWDLNLTRRHPQLYLTPVFFSLSTFCKNCKADLEAARLCHGFDILSLAAGVDFCHWQSLSFTVHPCPAMTPVKLRTPYPVCSSVSGTCVMASTLNNVKRGWRLLAISLFQKSPPPPFFP